jgi:hypothetical protein
MPDAKTVIVAAARESLAAMPKHSDHSHGVVVGMAIDPDGNQDPQLVCVVEGVADPVWVVLDDDDLDGIARYLVLHERGLTPAELPN